MGIINDENSATVVTYDVTLEQMKNLIARDLNVSSDDITVNYVVEEIGGDFMDRFPGTKQVTKIKVTYKKKK